MNGPAVPGAPARRPAPGLRRAQGPLLRSSTPALRPAPPRVGNNILQSALTHTLARLSWLPMMALVGSHVVFGLDEFPVVSRVLLAVPGVIFLMESRSYLTSDRRELPFVPLAMLQFYVTFGFPIFFEVPFFDMSGPVFFSDATRIEGGLIVAIGSAALWGAARLAMRLGRNLRLRVVPLLPPEVVGDGWDAAFYAFTGLVVLAVAINTFAPRALPSAIGMVVFLTFAIDFAMGLAITRPPVRLGSKSSTGLALVGIAIGLLNGQVEPMARTVMGYVAGRWVAVRRVAFGFIISLVVLFVVMQPLKGGYRAAVGQASGHTSDDVGLSGRWDAWDSAISDVYSGSSRPRKSASPLSRLSALSPVMHALVVVPSRVDYAYGATFAQIFYAPIPRLIWPGKPTSREEIAQRYAIVFGLQSEAGADTTAIGMCLLVEGLWNFGWPGVVFVCAAVGLLMGAQQRLFSGTHWALRSAGVAQLSGMIVAAPLVLVYGSLFQLVVARLLGVWLVYWLAQLLGTGARRAPVGTTLGAARG